MALYDVEFKHRNFQDDTLAKDAFPEFDEAIHKLKQRGTSERINVDFSFNRLSPAGLRLLLEHVQELEEKEKVAIRLCVGCNHFYLREFCEVLSEMKLTKWIEEGKVTMGDPRSEREQAAMQQVAKASRTTARQQPEVTPVNREKKSSLLRSRLDAGMSRKMSKGW
eukprot:CAMPEP_0117656730 /NCGR_PEP_ID=MMETSP0804-20121206/4958_1 /TAXON_ID=1074897 /ORGANISM="Tetraselmis astigmatica, Strain CCMP880" /LENGTH=165 /DNA_ID=CAMNT_0005463147 /DNA_START=438 /DNA_END=932 /DNA_ORIENTATION=-